MKITKKKMDTNLENRILIGMVTSDKFIKIAAPMIKPEFFISKYGGAVARWCKDYYLSYGHAPKKGIMDIYDNHRRIGDSHEDMEMIGEFLTNLSKTYENMDDPNFNADHMFDQTENYCQERAAKLLTEDVESYLLSGRVKEAIGVISDFKIAAKDLAEGIDPFTNREALESAIEIEETGLFTMPDALGKMLGPFKREYLIGVAAPMKRGKSAMMLDIALQAYYDKLHVAFFNLEMSRNQTTGRIARAVTSLPRKEGTYTFPVWDCEHNQLGTCSKRRKSNPIIAEKIPKGRNKQEIIFKTGINHKQYKPCVKCEDILITTWKREEYKPALTAKHAIECMEGIKNNLNPAEFRVVCWPAYSAGIQEIQNCLRTWEAVEGFMPDIIVVDYADILKPQSNFNEERHNLDRIWKGLKSLAQSTKSVVISATQTRRSTLEKGNVGQEDIAEDIRKLAHVDVMMGISQTAKEKQQGLARIGVLAQRHDSFDVLSQCYILQQLDCGQFCLDSKFKKF